MKVGHLVRWKERLSAAMKVGNLVERTARWWAERMAGC
jgi:hypothetical protein